MQITEAEYVKLINMAVMPLGGSGLPARFVSCMFGPSSVRLTNEPTNEWAIRAVEEWRTTAPALGQEGGGNG